MTNGTSKQLGNYRLFHLLGQGGFADVYLGEHLYLKTLAAIKVLRIHQTNEILEHFLSNGRTLACLEHDNIVRILEFGVEGETPFLVMEYAPNGTLRQRYPKRTPLPLTTIFLYLQQVAAGLQYIHNHQLIHGDVKPENLLLGPHDELLLSDFGLTSSVQSRQVSGRQEVIGTPSYMAPEQFRGILCPASDQYALAITLYEWLCGDRPFHGTLAEIATQHALTPPPPFHEKDTCISPAVEQIILKALAKDPQQRFPSVQDFVNCLKQAYQREPYALETSQPSISSALRGNHFSRRAIIVGLAGLLLAGGIPWSLRFHTLPPQGTTFYTYHDSPRYDAHQETMTAGKPRMNAIWSSDGKRITFRGNDGMTHLYDANTWKAISSYPCPIKLTNTSIMGIPAYSLITWAPDGKQIAAIIPYFPTVEICDAATGKAVSTFDVTSLQFGVSCLGWAPDSKQIACGGALPVGNVSSEGVVLVCDAKTGTQALTYHDPSNGVLTVAWSPEGHRIASGNSNYAVQVWNAATGDPIFTYLGQFGAVQTVAWSPDGYRIASGGEDHLVQIWDADTGKHALVCTGHSDTVTSIAWSPNGKYIASGSADHTVRIWNATTGDHLFTYRRHSALVNTVAWSPDGTRIVSGSEDLTARIWQAI